MDYNNIILSAEKRVREFKELQELGMIIKTGEFIPAGVHYPPITKYEKIAYNEMFKNYTLPHDGFLDVYVHIPFCAKRCIFCHYPSLYGAAETEKDKYLDALEKEMDIYLNTLGIDKIKLRVALVGGGTPTDLTPKQLKRFLKMFTSRCDMTKTRQFNYDLSPSTIIGETGLERLRILKDYGVDRLTIGVQTMNDEIMKKMNRSHSKKEALEAINNSMNMGFKTNIEFIYGHPGQTVYEWYKELEEIVKINVNEIQFYRLKVDAYGDQQGTIKTYKKLHPEDCPSAEDSIRMKQMVFDYLKEYGYTENLRRVFTKKKSDISLYAFNQCCDQRDQIAFGLTGFSSLRDRFILNTQNFDEYYTRIDNGILPFNRGYIRDSEAQQRWALILPLKNYYVRKKRYKEITGIDIENSILYPTIQLLKKYDLIEENDYTVKLTEKGGFFSDEVVCLFYDTHFITKDKKLFNDGPLNPYLLNNNK